MNIGKRVNTKIGFRLLYSSILFIFLLENVTSVHRNTAHYAVTQVKFFIRCATFRLKSILLNSDIIESTSYTLYTHENIFTKNKLFSINNKLLVETLNRSTSTSMFMCMVRLLRYDEWTQKTKYSNVHRRQNDCFYLIKIVELFLCSFLFLHFIMCTRSLPYLNLINFDWFEKEQRSIWSPVWSVELRTIIITRCVFFTPLYMFHLC